MASLTTCCLHGAAIKRVPPLGPGRALTLPCGWNKRRRVFQPSVRSVFEESLLLDGQEEQDTPCRYEPIVMLGMQAQHLGRVTRRHAARCAPAALERPRRQEF